MQDDQGGAPIRVVKLRYDGQPLFAWQGRLLEEEPDHVLLAGRFNATSRDLGYVTLEHGDLFLEWYYFGRWYNVFQIYSRTGQLKGWYCNVTTPARLEDGELTFTDLALDLFVYPDGRYLVLDEEEYAKARSEVYRPEEVREADRAVQELTTLARQQRLPRHGMAP